jgi:hypothetical protein
VPTFEKHDRPDVQWKLVQLYFILGWNCDAIGARYGLIRQRVRQILTTWKRRAVEMGFIQYIPPVERLIVVPLRPPATLPTFGFLSTSPLPGPDATSLVSDVSAAH